MAQSNRGILRLTTLGLLVLPTFSALSDTVNSRGTTNQQTFNRMVALVAAHDLAIPIGLLPTIPGFGASIPIAAEATELSANIALKLLPPWLEAPPDVAVDPGAACSYQFTLPSPRGDYENMFGFFNIKGLVDSGAGGTLRWDDPGRWGVLRAPKVYHANTSVEVHVRAGAVSLFDPATGQLNDPNEPINLAIDFQQPEFPIGSHLLIWTAETKINPIADVITPTALFALNLLTELKNARGGAQAAKKLENLAITESVIDDAPTAAEFGRITEGAQRYGDIWKGQWKSRQALKAAKEKSAWRKKLVNNILCKVSTIGMGLLDTAAQRGLERVDNNTGTMLARSGHITNVEKGLMDSIVDEAFKAQRDTSIAALTSLLALVCKAQTGVDDNDGIKFATEFTLTFAGNFDLGKLTDQTTASSMATQYLSVLDTVPPTISIDPTPVIFEATAPDGVSQYEVREHLLSLVMPGVADNCGRTPELSSNMPEILPLQLPGEDALAVTWTARDRGPNPSSAIPEMFAPTALQYVQVLDRSPPLLLVPPAKVVLVSPGATGSVNVALGKAAVVDLADLEPLVENDAPQMFAVNSRTDVHWTARDRSGNTSMPLVQVISVKDSNQAPVATAGITAATTTASEVKIRLSGTDFDELDGRTDPLWFKIEQYPRHGEFVAPLYPFFIEDYRTKPGDGGLPDDLLDNRVRQYIEEQYCNSDGAYAGEEPPRAFVNDALFVQVTDDGARFVLDNFYKCGGAQDAESARRISKWNSSGDFLGQVEFSGGDEARPHNNAFVLDRDGYLYYFTAGAGGSSQELALHQLQSDFENLLDGANQGDAVVRSYQFKPDAVPQEVSNWDTGTVSYARVDSIRNLIYIGNSRSLFVFEQQEDGRAVFLAEAGPQSAGAEQVKDDWLGRAAGIEVASDGSVYIADDLKHRIHKVAPGLQLDGHYVPGVYVGWAGRCSGSSNQACNESQQRSRGYSCTDDTCSATPLAGDQPGQFNQPRYVALDTRDILYVADYSNDRIQRLAPDGQFAGEAVSTGTGINRGNKPGFILGNFESPASVSVNASQFYVVDSHSGFIHVFGTLPFSEITDSEASVIYRSGEHMPNAGDGGQDEFVFSVSDGLETGQATVTIDIERTFRAPEALPLEVDVAEDPAAPLLVSLPGQDPDGVIGRDYFGRDRLTYTVTTQPRHGELSGDGETREYTPAPDYFGTDSFSYRVNDGIEDSEEATVTINVTPVNDPPVLVIEPPGRLGRGFRFLLNARFLDDDVPADPAMVQPEVATDELPPARYDAAITWGDGSTSTLGDFDSSDPDQPRIDGVAVAEPPDIEQEGRTFAEHVFNTTGSFSTEVCVRDAGGLPGCDTVPQVVEDLVKLGVSATVSTARSGDDIVTAVSDREAFSYELILRNEVPESWAGLPAQATALRVELPPGLLFGELRYTRGDCTRQQLVLTCTFGDLEPGAEVMINLEAQGQVELLSSEDKELGGVFTTTSDALEPAFEFQLNLFVLADTTDSDGDGMSDSFEVTYGLNPGLNDAGQDADQDGLTNLQEFEIGTSPRARDSDLDGLSDAQEYQTFGTDPNNADTDGDGMHDGWEQQFGFDPLDDTDGSLDSDGDGASNYEEFLQGGDPRRDDIPPTVVAPDDVFADSTGALTAVQLGVARAVDGKTEGIVALPGSSGPFPPGRNAVVWTARDEAGNAGMDVQLVNIKPQVSLAADQLAYEGGLAVVPVLLNGLAVHYPVRIPYSISGTAQYPDDHSGVSGVVEIEGGVQGSIGIELVNDDVAEPEETIVVIMGQPENAVPGLKTVHSITVTDRNRQPAVDIVVEQMDRPTAIIIADRGPVSPSAEVRDDPDDLHSFDWSASDHEVVNPAVVSLPRYTLDPALLREGLYHFRVGVTDDGQPPETTRASTIVRLLSETPQLSASDDSDGDGVDDATEGFGDSDGDRIPDYLDASEALAILPLGPEGQVLQTNPGYRLRLGESSFGAGYALATMAESDLGTDVEFGYPDGVYDFEVAGLDSGGSAQVVIPLVRALAEGSRYRNYLDGQWSAFVENVANAIASTSQTPGACPPPSSVLYLNGLSPGDYCVQLTLRDGGPNDADGLANGVIVVAGGIAVPVNVQVTELEKPATPGTENDYRVLKHFVFSSTSGDALLEEMSFAIEQSDNVNQDYLVSLQVIENPGSEAGSSGRTIAQARLAASDREIVFHLTPAYAVPPGETEIVVILQRVNHE